MIDKEDLELIGKGVVLYVLALVALLGAALAIAIALGIGWRVLHWAAGVGG